MENKDNLVIELENIISKERVLLEQKDSQLEHLEEENGKLHFMLKERKDGMWILSHVHSNEIAKAGADDASVLSAPLTYLELFSRAKSRNSLAHSTGASLVSGFSIRWLSDCSRQLLLASLAAISREHPVAPLVACASRLPLYLMDPISRRRSVAQQNNMLPPVALAGNNTGNIWWPRRLTRHCSKWSLLAEGNPWRY
ncbi:hypothetical protein AVEN_195480-1 [Araneus ventricosus]|uniref:Uncharacterized protein n=1 Tax=Araneus ventricosus TaxID=182803 RepID=A0A4Y2U7V8_ARAVE|nr:hypothetical protein AVEN_234164-1 [Araneus ventricosus]GBO08888.1 hypothetical protein AVEN_195480-1 [Araneus ventricosus]